MAKEEHIQEAEKLINIVKFFDLREPVSMQDILAAQVRLDDALTHLYQAEHGEE